MLDDSEIRLMSVKFSSLQEQMVLHRNTLDVSGIRLISLEYFPCCRTKLFSIETNTLGVREIRSISLKFLPVVESYGSTLKYSWCEGNTVDFIKIPLPVGPYGSSLKYP